QGKRGPTRGEGSSMSAEENEALVRRYMEAAASMEAGNLDAAAEFLGADYTDRTYPPGVAPSFEGWKQTHGAFFAAFPERRYIVADLVAEGDKVVARLTLRLTHAGAFNGIPPTGKHVEMPVIQILR